MLPRDMLRRCALNWPNKAAYYWRDQVRTWQDMDVRSDLLASALSRLGVGRRDVVAILGKESLQIYEHFHACMKLGALRLGMNWRYVPVELLHILRDAAPRVLLLEAQCAELVAPLAADIRELGIQVVGYGGQHGYSLDYETLLAREESAPDLPLLQGEDPLVLTYTSGSTGKPKGVVHTQQAAVNIILQSLIARGLSPDDVWSQASASSWMTVLLNVLGLGNGMSHVIMDGAFRVDAFLRDVERRRITAIMLVPTLLKRVLEENRNAAYDLSSLRLLMYGSSPITPQLAQAALETFNCELIQSYGMTEGGWVAQLSAADHRAAIAGRPELLTSVGRPGVMSEISIRGPEGERLSPGEIGEVWLKNEMLMRGYLNMPEETRHVLHQGWLRTNDLGSMDEEGYFYLHGRKSFMIITGAVNVFPSGVEAILCEHPAVSEVAVVGAPHPDLGEAVVAVVVPAPGAPEPEPEELMGFCSERLSKMSVPKHFFVVEELPTTSTGKVQKHIVKDWVFRNAESLPWRKREGGT